MSVWAPSRLSGGRGGNLPSLGRYVDALHAGNDPPRELEPLDGRTRAVERLMLGLRLDEPFPLDDVASVVDRDALARLAERGLVELRADVDEVLLTRRGRLLGGGVTAELLA